MGEDARKDIIAYTACLDAAARVGDADAAQSWLQKLQEAGLSPNEIAFNAVMDANLRAGDLSGATVSF
ncbi:hypothetical protein AK812_SmicGene19879 [Symbiodinium microadriaticum]|uniref:Uncharacterized protein n=1 Tax=Symbiodinium microadriaticum TaxID=2951 RepID=A0A1Q9DRE5_SYMMI|nr:hypothetical protein AK812_SmicGene19879 [Symbiodinium microadriaticum]